MNETDANSTQLSLSLLTQTNASFDFVASPSKIHLGLGFETDGGNLTNVGPESPSRVDNWLTALARHGHSPAEDGGALTGPHINGGLGEGLFEEHNFEDNHFDCCPFPVSVPYGRLYHRAPHSCHCGFDYGQFNPCLACGGGGVGLSSRRNWRVSRWSVVDDDREELMCHAWPFHDARHRRRYIENEEDASPPPETAPTGVGAGLSNLGNTCFINAILQCFTHTVPLVKALCSRSHTVPCHIKEFCLLSTFCEHVKSSLASSGKIISPVKFFDNLNDISPCFRKYQQEDAHEFLQCFLDKLERCSLDSHSIDESPFTRGYNLVKQIFGGRLVSKLLCCNCGQCSEKFEPFIDMSLEIEEVSSLESALESFTKVEKIEDPEVKFTCESCKKESSMEKQLMLDEAPLVATLHLKRFKTDGSRVEKIGKHVKFPLELDLEPYTNRQQVASVELKYQLYAIVVHNGLFPTSGHYFCYIRSSPNVWHKMDDSQVIKVEAEFVLSQTAYILFYAREDTPWFSSLIGSEKQSEKLFLEPSIEDRSPKSVLNNVDGECPSHPALDGTDNLSAFSSVEATEAAFMEPSIENRSPKSVLDNVDGERLSYPVLDSIDNVKANTSVESTEAPLVEPSIGNRSPKSVLYSVDGEHLSHPVLYRMDKVTDNSSEKSTEAALVDFLHKTILEEVQTSETEIDTDRESNEFRESRQNDTNLRGDVSKGDSPMVDASLLHRQDDFHEEIKNATPSSFPQSQDDNLNQETDSSGRENSFHPCAPLRSSSPDLNYEVLTGTRYELRGDYLKVEKRLINKQVWKKSAINSKRRESSRYIHRITPMGRRLRFMAGIHSRNDKRRRLRSFPLKKAIVAGTCC